MSFLFLLLTFLFRFHSLFVQAGLREMKAKLAFTGVVSKIELTSSSITQLVQINTVLVNSVVLYASCSSYKLNQYLSDNSWMRTQNINKTASHLVFLQWRFPSQQSIFNFYFFLNFISFLSVALPAMWRTVV